MKIVTETLDTKKGMIKYISQELIKLIDIVPGEIKKISLSLDLNRPAYISVEKKVENEKATFVCIWEERSGTTIYENISTDKTKLVEDVTNMLAAQEEKFRKNKECFEKKCYSAYQLDWMMSHGYSLDDLYRVMLKYEKEMFDPEDFIKDGEERSFDFDESDLERSAMQARDILLFEQGFGNGSIFACMNEFLNHEYRDAYYMKHLFDNLSDKDNMVRMYEIYTGIQLSSVPEFSVDTKAGIINAYRNCDNGAPGVIVMLQPKAYEDAIDCASVTVYEEPGYRTEDNEGDMDVVIHTYGDAFDENYTNKEIIRRNDVISALGTAAHV